MRGDERRGDERREEEDNEWKQKKRKNRNNKEVILRYLFYLHLSINVSLVSYL